MIPSLKYIDHLVPDLDLDYADYFPTHTVEEEPFVATTHRQTPPKRPAPKRSPTRTPPPSRRGPSSSPKKSANNPFAEDPLCMILYGPSGVGKTDLASRFPDAGFLYDPREPGILDLVKYKQTDAPAFAEEVSTFQGTLDAIDRVANGDLPCQTLVLDSISGIEHLCFKQHCDMYFEGNWTKDGFLAFQQGPKNAAKTDWPELLEKLDLVRAAGISTILIGHSTVKSYSNPNGADYDRFIATVDKATWDITHRWSQAIIFYNYDVSMAKEGRTKAKATGHTRYLYTQWDPAWDAKNRYGLPPCIEAGTTAQDTYDNFEAAFSR